MGVRWSRGENQDIPGAPADVNTSSDERSSDLSESLVRQGDPLQIEGLDLSNTQRNIDFQNCFRDMITRFKAEKRKLRTHGHCEVCNLKAAKYQKLMTCSRCLTAIYCSRKCQLIHYKGHKRVCSQIGTALKAKKLHLDMLMDVQTHEDTTLEHHRQAYDEYCTSLQLCCLSYQLLTSRNSTLKSMMLLLELLLFVRLREHDMYSMAPFLFLRLGLDSEAYSMCKWIITTTHIERRSGLSLPFPCDVWDLAEESSFLDKSTDLRYLSAVLLVKLRYIGLLKSKLALNLVLLGALSSSKSPVKVLGGHHVALWTIKNFLFSGPLGIYGISESKITHTISTMESQCKELFKLIEDCNSYYFDYLISPKQVSYLPESEVYTRGGTEEAFSVLGISIYPWEQSSAECLQFIRDMKKSQPIK